ncbi:MAG: hypothetical protein HZB29_09940 [Nitrospinae bacterium]|nr:hypothetical protein [Nitrospinota bacterium]
MKAEIHEPLCKRVIGVIAAGLWCIFIWAPLTAWTAVFGASIRRKPRPMAKSVDRLPLRDARRGSAGAAR